MTPKDKPKFVAAIEGMAALKPGARLTPESFELFWAAMAPDWSLEEFKAAAAHLVRSVEFMPNPYHFAELRKAARPTAAEEWANVLDLARGREARALSPVAERALAAIGGIEAVRMSETTKTPFLERRFCEHYAELRDVAEVRTALPEIAGKHGPLMLVGDGLKKLGLRGEPRS